jgi:hypothetical protein
MIRCCKAGSVVGAGGRVGAAGRGGDGRPLGEHEHLPGRAGRDPGSLVGTVAGTSRTSRLSGHGPVCRGERLVRHRQPFKGQRLHEGLVQLIPARAARGPHRCLHPDHDPDHAHGAGAGGAVSRRVGKYGRSPAAGRLLEGCEPRTPTAVIGHRVSSDTERVIGLAGRRGYRRRATARPPRSSSPGALWRSPNGRASQSPGHRVASSARRWKSPRMVLLPR